MLSGIQQKGRCWRFNKMVSSYSVQGCYNKLLSPAWLKQQNISHSSEGWEVQDQVLAGLVSLRALALVCKWPPSPRIHLREREEASSLVTLLIRTQILSCGFHPHDLVAFRGPIFKSILLGIGVSGYEFGGNTHTVSSLQALYGSLPLNLGRYLLSLQNY